MLTATDLTISCPAKINLALSVGAPRVDGMHPIASWMAALSFADTLRLRRLEGEASRFQIVYAEDAPSPRPVDWPLEKDLAYRAHALLQEHVGRLLPVDAVLTKRIPTGAGLGGGSSDAAGMLVGLNRLFELGVGKETLLQLSSRLGSDVVFLTAALLGDASAIVTGTGDCIESSPMTEVMHLVLILPELHSPTGSVYRAFDTAFPPGKTADEAAVRSLAAMNPVPQDGPFNDLADPATTVTPPLGMLLEKLRVKLQLPAHVTGSGAAMFVIAPSAITAQALARKVMAEASVPAVATRTMPNRTQPLTA